MSNRFVSGFEYCQAGIMDLVLPGVLHIEALTITGNNVKTKKGVKALLNNKRNLKEIGIKVNNLI